MWFGKFEIILKLPKNCFKVCYLICPFFVYLRLVMKSQNQNFICWVQIWLHLLKKLVLIEVDFGGLDNALFRIEGEKMAWSEEAVDIKEEKEKVTMDHWIITSWSLLIRQRLVASLTFSLRIFTYSKAKAFQVKNRKIDPSALKIHDFQQLLLPNVKQIISNLSALQFGYFSLFLTGFCSIFGARKNFEKRNFIGFSIKKSNFTFSLVECQAVISLIYWAFYKCELAP